MVASPFLGRGSLSFSRSIKENSARYVRLANIPNTIAAISAMVLSCVKVKVRDATKNTSPVPRVIKKSDDLTFAGSTLSYTGVQYTTKISRLSRKALQLTNSKK